jgi:hypothetical protein
MPIVTGRDPVDSQRLRAFLDALGRRFPHPARLFLAGGESLVWRGLRGTTRDVDIAYEVDVRWQGEWMGAIRALILEHRTSVEEASPRDFIPLPPGADGRAEFIGRFGQIDVFLFDPYSVALSKLERGHAQDLADVRAMLSKGVLDAKRLHEAFEAILSEYARRRVQADPVRFRARVEEALRAADPKSS